MRTSGSEGGTLGPSRYDSPAPPVAPGLCIYPYVPVSADTRRDGGYGCARGVRRWVWFPGTLRHHHRHDVVAVHGGTTPRLRRDPGPEGQERVWGTR